MIQRLPTVIFSSKPIECAAGVKPQILLVEDSLVNQKLATQLLRRLKHACDVASDGYQAVDAVRNQHYDLIFMDVQLPKVDGLAATREIRRHSNDKESLQPYIVAMTANSHSEALEACFLAGMDDAIRKPYVTGDFHRVLSLWLGPTAI